MSLLSLIFSGGRDILRGDKVTDIAFLIMFIAFLVQTINWFLAMREARVAEQRANYWWDLYVREVAKRGGSD